MNGFTNTVLTMLLSWLKALISSIWSVLSSEDGGALYVFFAAHWKTLLLLLCVGGLVADGIIYLFRWRPYYVWLRRPLHASRHGWQQQADPAAYAQPMQQPAYEPSMQPTYEQPIYEQPIYEQPAYEPATYAPASQNYPPQSTRVYQPVAQYAPAAQSAAPYSEPMEPLFDDDPAVWDDAQPLVSPHEDLDMPATFGAPQPEPLAYLRDMQAGFARPLPPEQLYAPAAAQSAPQPGYAPGEPPAAPVHPGLGADAFRQSFGLSENEPNIPTAVMHAPAFRPFTMRQEAEPPKGQHALARFARRARDLVGVDDAANRRTIHDLQSTVDVSTAFHDPVYPMPRQYEGGEE